MNETTQAKDNAAPGRKRVHRRKLLLCAVILLAVGAVASVLAMLFADMRVESRASGRIYKSVEEIPAREYGLMLGTTRLVKGKYRNDYFYNRVRAAAELYRAGKIRKVIVSGDNGRTEYNETADMKQELAAEGVPPEDVLMDYAGFRTLDSVIRARNLFGASEIMVITQEFHCERAVYLASENGIDAIGFAAKDTRVQSARLRLTVREAFARVLAVIDAEILHRKPHFEY